MKDKGTRTIAFSSIKGGVGKSVSSIMFAEILSERGKTLLIDFDSQASVTSYYLKPENGDYISVYEIVRGEANIKDGLLSINENLDVLPSHIRLSKLGDNKQAGYEYLLFEALSTIKEEYRFIVIDTPPSLSSELTNALTIANIVCIPVIPDIWSVEAIEILRERIEKVKRYYNQSMEAVYVFPTLIEERRTVDKQINDILINSYKSVYLNVPIHKTSAIQKMVTYRERPKKRERYYLEYSHIVSMVLGEEWNDDNLDSK